MNEPLRIAIPKKFIELSNKQLKEIARIKLIAKNEVHFLSLALLYLTGLKVVKTGEYYAEEDRQVHYYRHKKHKKPFIIDSFVFTELLKRVEWLLKDDECKPLRSIGLSRPYNYRFYNATFETYLMAENYFQAFSYKKDVTHLNCLVATLYNLPFQKFNSNKIKKRSFRFQRTNMQTKLAVYMWYAGFRKYVSAECPTLFKPSGSGKPVKIKEQINSMMRMVNKGYINDNPGIMKAKVWDALYEMEAMAKEVESIRQNVPKK